MLKKLVLFVAAVMLLASSAFANPKDVKVSSTSPTLPREVCAQAGSLVLHFDAGTSLNSSVSFSGELPMGKFCKPVDLYVNATADILNSVVGPLQGNGTYVADSGNKPFILHVSAVENSNTLNFKVLGSSNMTAGVNGLKLVLFDSSTTRGTANENHLLTGTWDATAGRLMNPNNDTAAVNSLCVQSLPSVVDGSNLVLSLSSDPKKYNFDDPTPRIAVIAGASSISEVPAKVEMLYKELPTGDQGQGCSANYETGDGLCPSVPQLSSTGLHGHFALKNGARYASGDYYLDMEILVNGASGDHGVYFGGVPGGLQFTDAESDLWAAFSVTNAFTADKYYLGNGAETPTSTVLAAGCDIKKEAKVVKISGHLATVDATNAAKRFLRVGIPVVNVTKDASAKDKVALKITLRQGRCNVIFDSARDLFAIVDKCREDVVVGNGLLLPYFADYPFWNGLALTNPGLRDVNATLAFVDEKGGKGNIDITVPAQSMYVKLLPEIIEDSNFNGTVDSSKRCYVEVKPKSKAALKAFVMMGNAGESMGYVVD